MVKATAAEISKKVAFKNIVAIHEDEIESNRNESSDCSQLTSRTKRILIMIYIIIVIIMLGLCAFVLIWVYLIILQTDCTLLPTSGDLSLSK